VAVRVRGDGDGAGWCKGVGGERGVGGVRVRLVGLG